LLATIAPAVVLASLTLLWTPAPPLPSGRPSRCETHLVSPARGEPFPMTVCR